VFAAAILLMLMSGFITVVDQLVSSGEAGQGSTQYYLASAFDKIFMQPSGLVGLIGVSMQSLFFKDFLAKIGVQAQIFNYHEYKNAVNMLTESSFTDAHREQSQRLTDGMFELVCCQHRQCFPISSHSCVARPTFIQSPIFLLPLAFDHVSLCSAYFIAVSTRAVTGSSSLGWRAGAGSARSGSRSWWTTPRSTPRRPRPPGSWMPSCTQTRSVGRCV
jgi:hypothetical protein